MTSQPTLRALARELRCQHSALNKAVHDGRLTAGVRLDPLGRIVVFDAAAAAAEWREIHAPRIDELIRREAEAKAPPQPVAPGVVVPGVVVIDRHTYDWTARELLGAYEVNHLLVRALIKHAKPRNEAAFVKQVMALLRDQGCDAETEAHAARSLPLTVEWTLHPEAEDDA